jgi:hypothetical protein
MVETVVVKTTTVEISPVLSFEERAIVFEIEAIPIVAVPGRIIIVRIAREIGFTDGRSGIVSASIYGSWSICISIHDRRSDIDSWHGDAHAKTGADIYLGIAFGSDEAGGDYGCKDE